MPSKITLILGIIFILFLFIIDYKRKSKVSGALWIPLIWMMIIGSRMVSLWFYPAPGMAAENYLEGSPIDRNIFIILMVAGLFILFRRKIYWSQVFNNNAWIFLFFYYCGISILWSDFPEVAFKRWLKAIGNLIMVLIVLTDSDPVEAVKTMLRRCAYVLIPLSIVLIKYFPLLGRKYHRYSGELTVTGVTVNKNALGNLCLICGVFFLWQLLSMWRDKNVSIKKMKILVYILIFFMILWLLLLANSATSLLCFFISVCLLIWLKTSDIKRNARFIGFYIFFTILIVSSLLFLFSVPQNILSNLGRDTTFTGRTEVWEDCIDLSGNPLIGIGYDSFWLGKRIEKLWDKYWWHPTESHNGYLEIYLELGLLGLFLLIGIIILTYRKVSKELISDFEFASFQMSILCIVLVYNVMEAAFKGLHLTWFIFLLIAIEYPRISASKNIGGINTSGGDFLKTK